MALTLGILLKANSKQAREELGLTSDQVKLLSQNMESLQAWLKDAGLSSEQLTKYLQTAAAAMAEMEAEEAGLSEMWGTMTGNVQALQAAMGSTQGVYNVLRRQGETADFAAHFAGVSKRREAATESAYQESKASQEAAASMEEEAAAGADVAASNDTVVESSQAATESMGEQAAATEDAAASTDAYTESTTAATGATGRLREGVAVTSTGLHGYLTGARGSMNAFAEAIGATIALHFAERMSEDVIQLSNLANATGASVAQLAELRIMLEQNGVDAMSMQNTLLSLSAAMSKASVSGSQQAQLFKDMHINTEGWAKNMPSAITVMLEMADAMHKYGHAATGAAQQLLGFFGIHVLPIMAQGKKAILEQMAAFAALGAEMQRNVEAAREFQATWVNIKTTIDVGLLPTLGPLADALKAIFIVGEVAVHSISSAFEQLGIFGQQAGVLVGGVIAETKDAMKGHFAAMAHDYQSTISRMEALNKGFAEEQKVEWGEVARRIAEMVGGAISQTAHLKNSLATTDTKLATAEQNLDQQILETNRDLSGAEAPAHSLANAYDNLSEKTILLTTYEKMAIYARDHLKLSTAQLAAVSKQLAAYRGQYNSALVDANRLTVEITKNLAHMYAVLSPAQKAMAAASHGMNVHTMTMGEWGRVSKAANEAAMQHAATMAASAPGIHGGNVALEQLGAHADRLRLTKNEIAQLNVLLPQFGKNFQLNMGLATQAIRTFQSVAPATMERFSQALGKNIAMAILYGASVTKAMERALKGILASITAQAAVKAILETAKGFEYLADRMYPQAALAFKSAALYGSIGAAAGAIASAIPGGGGGGRGAGRGVAGYGAERGGGPPGVVGGYREAGGGGGNYHQTIVNINGGQITDTHNLQNLITTLNQGGQSGVIRLNIAGSSNTIPTPSY